MPTAFSKFFAYNKRSAAGNTDKEMAENPPSVRSRER